MYYFMHELLLFSTSPTYCLTSEGNGNSNKRLNTKYNFQQMYIQVYAEKNNLAMTGEN